MQAKGFVQSAVAASVFLVASSTAVGAEYRTPSNQVRQAGVASYLVEEQARSVKVRLLGLRHEDLGVVRVEVGFDGYRNISYQWKGSVYGILWNPEAREVTFSTNREAALLRAIDEAWVVIEGETALIEENRKTFEMVSRVLADFKEEIRVIERIYGLAPLRQQREELDLFGISVQPHKGSSPLFQATGSEVVLRPFSAADTTCGGAQNRGEAVADTRSACCEEANDEVQGECWNSQCVGCCSTGSCDASCVFGDYFCFCGVSGTGCAAQ